MKKGIRNTPCLLFWWRFLKWVLDFFLLLYVSYIYNIHVFFDFLQEGKEKRKDHKKEYSDENEENQEIQKAPEPEVKKKTGFKSMHKTFGQKFSPKAQRKKTKASVALMKVFPNELENQKNFDGFTEWLQTFELYR